MLAAAGLRTGHLEAATSLLAASDIEEEEDKRYNNKENLVNCVGIKRERMGGRRS